MYITEIDLGGHGECVECTLGPYRFEKPSKNQLKFMKIVTIGIPVQMDILMLPLPKKLRMVLFGASQLRNFSTLFDNF